MSGSDCCVETPIIPAQKALSSYQHTHTPSIDPWIEANNQVDETGSLAEASRSCGADAGDGVLAGAPAWTTVNLPPGRYELL